MREYLDPRAFLGTIGALAIGLVLIVLALAVDFSDKVIFPHLPGPVVNTGSEYKPSGNSGVVRFNSAQEFTAYLTKAAENSVGYGGIGMGGVRTLAMPMEELSVPQAMGLDGMKSDSNTATNGSASADRVSGTNVQVAGIDEPDIVKTDGKQIYVSQPQYYYYGGLREMPMIDISPSIDTSIDSKIMPPRQPVGGVKTVAAFPPADLAVLGAIDASGDLLISDKILVVFGNDKISGYNIADPKTPIKTWEAKYGENHRLVTARLANGKLYTVTQATASIDRPCPIKPFILGDTDVIVPCVDVYHPVASVPVDSTFTVSIFDPETGAVKQNVSFLGSSSASVVAMFDDSLYVTYSYPGDVLGFIVGALSDSSDILPAWFLEKVQQLKGYDISLQSKMTEFSQLMDRLQRSFTNDERLKMENELQNRMSRYAEVHQRELERTGIVKVKIGDLSVSATGEVPGQLLNQFALDEYEGNLRVATTFNGSWMGGFIGASGSSSASDVYVLDSKMNEVGSVKDLGKTERIYSVRFIGNRGYVVTFRQTDPFYVLDLTNPKAPKLAGELKIPGFSSYLHPIDTNRILGVGQDGGKVKLSLFNVSDATNPIEADKYTLDDYWSEVSSTHHAFLQDAKHNVVFIPGGKGGYIFSYTGDKLKLATAVSDTQVRRALYLNDYLYLVSNENITVLNEADWTKVNSLDITK